uniref:Uncharacterized protein n=1 Tax=Oryza sativa subsp. japonica TaxID=39947 RepID=Q656D3_ORYSJ|nr:hypothetical protein [Oryza sativa Japonica Group]
MVKCDCRFLLRLDEDCSGGRYFNHDNSGERFGHAHTSGAITLCLEGVLRRCNAEETKVRLTPLQTKMALVDGTRHASSSTSPHTWTLVSQDVKNQV